MSKDMKICAIGTLNTDILGKVFKELTPMNSNLGSITITTGGVAKNVAENIQRLGIETKLISIVGDDILGEYAIKNIKDLGINVEDIEKIKGVSSSAYMAILDPKGDMAVAISDSEVLKHFSLDLIKSKIGKIKQYDVCIIDTGFSKETLEYIVENCEEVKFFLDPISIEKSEKVKDCIGLFHTIKPNIFEAEVLAKMKIKDENDLIKASNLLIKKGVKNIFITLNKDGVFYNNYGKTGFYNIKNEIKIKSATGAGDAFTAGLVYSYLNSYDVSTTLKTSLAMSYLTLNDINSVNKNISVKKLEETIKDLIYE